ncbi:TonB family protein [Gammaproteobacteria bacterium]|nr:TonB family protein [Gammaproteobacteria bacterium]
MMSTDMHDDYEEFSHEEIKELFEEVDRSKKDTQKAYVVTSLVIVFALVALIPQFFSKTNEIESNASAVNVDQKALLDEMREQAAFLRSELTARQNDIRNDRTNFQTELTARKNEVDSLKNQMRQLEQELYISKNTNSVSDVERSSEITVLTEQIEEKIKENESLTVELTKIKGEISGLTQSTGDSSSEEMLREIVSLRQIIEERDAFEELTQSTDDSSSEEMLREIASLRQIIEERDVLEEDSGDLEIKQAKDLTEDQILFRDRLPTFFLILSELHKSVSSLELNTRNEIESLTFVELEKFRQTTKYNATGAYQKSLENLYDLSLATETLNSLTADQETQKILEELEADPSDLISKMRNLQNRPYETELFIATIASFISLSDNSPLSMQQPIYPQRALKREISGQVSMRFAITPNGAVDEQTIAILSGNDLFREAAMTSIRRTKYAANVIPEFVSNNISAEVIEKIKLFGFSQIVTFKME